MILLLLKYLETCMGKRSKEESYEIDPLRELTMTSR